MSKYFKVLIVDDEELSRLDLLRLLKGINNISVIDEASTIEEAIEQYKSNTHNIVFLDIQLTNESGFELIQYLNDSTKVIFVTAFDEYAVRAFEVNAQDYLLKPVSKERLSSAIEKATKIPERNIKDHESLSIEDSMFLKLDKNYKFLKLKKIKFITSADNYSEIVQDGISKKSLTNKSLKEWETRLPENHFCRIHRYTIVNIDFIEKVEPWHNYSYRVFIKNESKPLLMSRRYFSIIKEKLG